MVFLYVKGQGETLFPLGREDPICKGGKKRMKKKALKRIVSLLLGALLLVGCALPAGNGKARAANTCLCAGNAV